MSTSSGFRRFSYRCGRWLVLPIVFLLSALGVAGARPAAATTPGWVDLSYGVDGVAHVSAPTLSGIATAVDSAGRAVVLGATNANGSADRVTRLTAAGGLDGSFASGGVFTLPPATFYTQVNVAPSGNIYLLGGDAIAGGSSSQIVVTELTSSGAVVSGFGSGGTAAIAAAAVGTARYSQSEFTVRNDGDVLVAVIPPSAASPSFLAAISPAGVLDTTFGPPATPGRLVFPAGAVVYSPQAARSGNSVGVVLQDAQASPPVYGVQTFTAAGGAGPATYLGRSIIPFALAAAADGSLYATGKSGRAVAVAHVLVAGGLDGSFGTAGVLVGPPDSCSPAGGQVEQAGADVYVIAFFTDTSAGCRPSPAIALRVRVGQLDPTFGTAGQVVVDAVAATVVFGPNGGGVTPDGHLLIGITGSADPTFVITEGAVVRLHTAPAPASVQAVVQGADDLHFVAEHVADNPAKFTATPSPVVDSAGVSDVFLLGTDGHLYVSRRGASGWTAPADITAGVPGAPTLVSSPHAVADGNVLHVFALKAGTSDLVDYHNDGGGGAWLATDVSTSAGGYVPVTATLSAVRLGGMLHVYATSYAGDVIEIDNDHVAGHEWNFYNESALAGGGVVITGAPGPLLINGIPHVYTRALSTNDLVEFVADHLGGHIWNAYDQTHLLPGSPTLSGNPIPTLIGATPHVYVDDASNGDLVEFVADHLAGRIWNSYNQTTGSGAPPLTGNPTVVLVDGAPFGQPGMQVPEVFENASGTLAVVAADHQGGNIWNAYDVTGLSGGSPISGDPIAIINNGVVEVLTLAGGANNAAPARTKIHTPAQTPSARSGHFNRLAQFGR